MTTDKQIAATRRNAQKATGPKTAEGKFKSNLNALRLGLYSHKNHASGAGDKAML